MLYDATDLRHCEAEGGEGEEGGGHHGGAPGGLLVPHQGQGGGQGGQAQAQLRLVGLLVHLHRSLGHLTVD